MLQDARAAFAQIFTPPFRRVLAQSLALTFALLILAWVGLDKLVLSWLTVSSPWLATLIAFLAGLGLFVGLAFLVAPVSALVAGFFLDELAERVERDLGAPAGKPQPAARSIWLAAKFAAVSVLVNLCALLLLLVPGVNLVAFLGANAYLASREYFELAALRYRGVEETRAMRRDNALYIFLCGLPIAGLMAIPIVNLLTPLFGVAYMTRIHARLSRRAAP